MNKPPDPDQISYLLLQMLSLEKLISPLENSTMDWSFAIEKEHACIYNYEKVTSLKQFSKQIYLMQ